MCRELPLEPDKQTEVSFWFHFIIQSDLMLLIPVWQTMLFCPDQLVVSDTTVSST